MSCWYKSFNGQFLAVALHQNQQVFAKAKYIVQGPQYLLHKCGYEMNQLENFLCILGELFV